MIRDAANLEVHATSADSGFSMENGALSAIWRIFLGG
jgi:hypothetical protein